MKRGQSGKCLLLAVDKPTGMTSHDVVNSCRRIFGERRVGHTGTLDPLATGLLPICVGPATRLDKYLVGHDKTYRVTIGFGFETVTDDICGEVSAEAPVDAILYDRPHAASFVEGLVGAHEQTPPRYSAVKVNGVKSYEAARRGGAVELESRTIVIRDAQLMGVFEEPATGVLCWDAVFTVSKGTYIRSLARDIGRMLGTRAHVRGLRRLSAGSLSVDEAVTIETLEALGENAALDPVSALGFRFAFADELERAVCSGNALRADQLVLREMPSGSRALRMDACTSTVRESDDPPFDGELVSIVVANKLKAIYRLSRRDSSWKPDCVFSVGVSRG